MKDTKIFDYEVTLEVTQVDQSSKMVHWCIDTFGAASHMPTVLGKWTMTGTPFSMQSSNKAKVTFEFASVELLKKFTAKWGK